MAIEKVKPTVKEQPRASTLIATAKIVEALDPLYCPDRRRALIAALAIIGEEGLMSSVMQKQN